MYPVLGGSVCLSFHTAIFNPICWVCFYYFLTVWLNCLGCFNLSFNSLGSVVCILELCLPSSLSLSASSFFYLTFSSAFWENFSSLLYPSLFLFSPVCFFVYKIECIFLFTHISSFFSKLFFPIVLFRYIFGLLSCSILSFQLSLHRVCFNHFLSFLTPSLNLIESTKQTVIKNTHFPIENIFLPLPLKSYVLHLCCRVFLETLCWVSLIILNKEQSIQAAAFHKMAGWEVWRVTSSFPSPPSTLKF